jgi:replication factor A1
MNITSDSISKLFELCEENRSGAFNVNYYVQIYKIVRDMVEKGGQRLLPVLISDTINSMNAVLILANRVPVQGDILHLQNVNIVTLMKKTMIVKKFEIVGQGEVIGNPFQLDINTTRPVEIKPEPIYIHQNNDPVENIQKKMIVEDNDDKHFTPLSSLNTFTKDIHILVKITTISAIKEFKNDHNKGKLVNFTFIDEEGSEMQGTAFTKGIDKHLHNLEEGCVYEIHGGYLKINDKKFSTVKSDYKLIIDDSTEIIRSNRVIGNNSEPSMIHIGDLLNKQVYSVIDIMAYVLESYQATTINTKQGIPVKMKKIVCVDDSDYKIELTLWKEFSDLIIEPGDVIAMKSVKVGEYGGRSISSVDNSKIVINPTYREKLKASINDKIAKGFSFKSIQSKMSGNDAPTSSVDIGNASYLKHVINDYEAYDKCNSSKIKATILSLRHDDKNYYTGCETCKKKINRENDRWVCPNCNKEYDSPAYFYTLSLKVKDASIEAYIDFFGNVAEKLLNVSCAEYKHLIETKDETRLKEISSSIEFRTFNMTVKPKRNTYNNIAKIRINCFKSQEIDIATEARNIVKKLNTIIFRK